MQEMKDNFRNNNPLLSHYAREFARIRPNNKVMWRIQRDYWGNMRFVETRKVKNANYRRCNEKVVRRQRWEKQESLYIHLTHGYNSKVNRWL